MSAPRSDETIDRRRAIGTIGAAVGSARLLSLVLPLSGCLSQVAFRARAQSGRVHVPADELAKVSKQGVLVVKVDGLHDAIVVRRVGGAWIAVTPVCSHRACKVVPRPDGFDCPCHGSTFSADGQATRGPATEPLPRHPVETGPGGIVFAVRS